MCLEGVAADRLTKGAWIQHGFSVLREKGLEALKADRMGTAHAFPHRGDGGLWWPGR